MGKTKIITILTLLVAFCLLLISAEDAACITSSWAKNNLENRQRAVSIPIWKITKEGSYNSVRWANHAPNPRFAIYDPGTPGDKSDDLVLDKETGLIWARDANLDGEKIWYPAILNCRNLELGNRMGWRLPTVEELSSLVDPSESAPVLPSGHPFINVQYNYYWSSTTSEFISGQAWAVDMGDGSLIPGDKSGTLYVWPVRGGNGYATGNW